MIRINKRSSVQSLDRLRLPERGGGGGGGGGEGHDRRFCRFSFSFFLQGAIVSSSGMDRDFHSLMLSIQHFLSKPRRLPSKIPLRMVLERLSWFVTCPNHASFRLLTVAKRFSCGLTRKLIMLRTQSLVLCSKLGDAEKCPQALGFKSLDPFFRVGMNPEDGNHKSKIPSSRRSI